MANTVDRSAEDFTKIQEEITKGWEWETVAEETGIKVVFDTIGDTFIGQYLGRVTITPKNGDEPFDLFNFRGTDGRMYSLNTSHKLEEAFESIPTGTWTRTVYIKDVPVPRRPEPMKDFRVDVRK